MKTFLAVVGGLAIVIVIALVSLVVIGFQKAGPLMEEAHAYADEAIPAIVTRWDAAEFSRRASPELKKLLKEGDVVGLMAAGERQLGEMTAYNKATCNITGFEMSSNGSEFAQASCTATATHQRGQAAYVLNILKRNDEWKVFGFFVTPETTERGPVQVRFEQAHPQLVRTPHLSLGGQSIGFSAAATPVTGAGITQASKIDNTSQ